MPHACAVTPPMPNACSGRGCGGGASAGSSVSSTRSAPFVGDFVCLERKLIVEADGGQHNAQADRARTAYLRKRGFRIIRFWNHDILQNIDGVLETTLIALEGGSDRGTRNPLSRPCGRGGDRREAVGGKGLCRGLRKTLTPKPPAWVPPFLQKADWFHTKITKARRVRGGSFPGRFE